MPIVSVECPSHQVRARKTDHAASVEFDAEEYSPERDFELRIGLDRSQPLAVVPHRRADDGYFMLLVSPPDAEAGAWKRELMPEAEPLDVILVADTSGSMDRSARAAQATFIQAMLSLLGTKDQFRLLTCDVTAQWFNANSIAVTEENVAAALSWLDHRPSLGWTDLDLAFGEAGKVATERSLLVYIGDGIGTTGDADPVALAERVRALGKGTCHAIHVSSTYEKGVLEAIASIGGGSVRNGADNPVEAAYGLLAEAAQPAVKNLKVSFEGLRTARVYPERLPNLAAGTQQIVLGRFLPTAGDQTGTVTISGTLDGKPVRYSTELSIKGDEAGNSFLPRLWARKHLDVLLAQGGTPAIKEEIVAFSEEYGIMTPYTSFLVLESDAQREQYGVTRRVRMRDGERFFAKGRDQASTELLQQQMKLARSWRLRLRTAMLREIATLGRHLHLAPGVPLDSAVTLGNWGDAGGAARYLRGAEQRAKSVERLRHTADESIDGFFDDEGIDGDGAIDAPDEESYEEESDLGEEAPERSKKDELRSFDKKRKGGRRRPSSPSVGGLSRDWRARRENVYRQTPSPAHLYLFPPLPAPPAEPDAVPEPKWPTEVLELMRSVRSRDALAALPGGIRIRQDSEVVHAVNGHSLAKNFNAGLYGHA
ncbi:MAG: vWA domain-containing protein, partial [Planctomycetota bacterium]